MNPAQDVLAQVILLAGISAAAQAAFSRLLGIFPLGLAGYVVYGLFTAVGVLLTIAFSRHVLNLWYWWYEPPVDSAPANPAAVAE